VSNILRAVAGAAILAALALPSLGQNLGSVTLGTAQAQVFSGQTTAAVTPNSNPALQCTPTNGSPCAIPNNGQSVHTLVYSGGSCTSLDMRLEASYDGSTFFNISSDALDNSANAVSGLAGFGGVTAVGYYPVIRANLVKAVGCGGAGVNAFYSGTAATTPTTSAITQQASGYRVPVTIATVTSAAFSTIVIPTPFGSSAGSLFVQCSAACAAGGAYSVLLAPTDSGIGSRVLSNVAIAQVSTLQRFDIPAVNTNRVLVSLTPTGASANTWTIVYQFAPQGQTSLIRNSTQGGNSSSGAVTACDQFTPINTTASVQIGTGVAGTVFHICSFEILASAAENVALVEGTGATCGTSTAGVFGGATAATGWNLTAGNLQISLGSGFGFIGKTATAGDSLCLLVSAASQVSGGFTWTQLQNP